MNLLGLLLNTARPAATEASDRPPGEEPSGFGAVLNRLIATVVGSEDMPSGTVAATAGGDGPDIAGTQTEVSPNSVSPRSEHSNDLADTPDRVRIVNMLMPSGSGELKSTSDPGHVVERPMPPRDEAAESPDRPEGSSVKETISKRVSISDQHRDLAARTRGSTQIAFGDGPQIEASHRRNEIPTIMLREVDLPAPSTREDADGKTNPLSGVPLESEDPIRISEDPTTRRPSATVTPHLADVAAEVPVPIEIPEAVDLKRSEGANTQSGPVSVRKVAESQLGLIKTAKTPAVDRADALPVGEGNATEKPTTATALVVENAEAAPPPPDSPLVSQRHNGAETHVVVPIAGLSFRNGNIRDGAPPTRTDNVAHHPDVLALRTVRTVGAEAPQTRIVRPEEPARSGRVSNNIGPDVIASDPPDDNGHAPLKRTSTHAPATVFLEEDAPPLMRALRSVDGWVNRTVNPERADRTVQHIPALKELAEADLAGPKAAPRVDVPKADSTPAKMEVRVTTGGPLAPESAERAENDSSELPNHKRDRRAETAEVITRGSSGLPESDGVPLTTSRVMEMPRRTISSSVIDPSVRSAEVLETRAIPRTSPLQTAHVTVQGADGHVARIQVTVVGDQVMTRVLHPDPEVARILIGRGDELRAALSGHGLESSLAVSALTASHGSEERPAADSADRWNEKRDPDGRERDRESEQQRDRQQSRDARLREESRRHRRGMERWFQT